MIANLKAATLLQLTDELIQQQGSPFIVSGQYKARRNVASIKAEMDRRDREAAKLRKVWLVSAEHFSVPGLVQKVFSTKKTATEKALELVNGMLNDCGRQPAKAWRRGLDWLQENEDHCYVYITELTVAEG